MFDINKVDDAIETIAENIVEEGYNAPEVEALAHLIQARVLVHKEFGEVIKDNTPIWKAVECYREHRKNSEMWTFGLPVKAWRDSGNIICIEYESGARFSYEVFDNRLIQRKR